MFLLSIFTLLIHGALSITPCQDGVEIVTTETNNPQDIIGNWTYVYHWDPKIQFLNEFPDNDHSIECPELRITPITPEHVKARSAECAADKIPFNWDDAKLRVDAPVLKMEGGIIILGEKDNWMMVDCQTMVRVVIKKVSDEYIVMTNPDKDNTSELIVREAPTLEELKCISHNIDVAKGMSGFGICYKK